MAYYSIIRPFLFKLPPELAHTIAIQALRMGLVPTPSPKTYVNLHSSVFGRAFTNPVGMAAGFDKNAECIKALLNQGFGFVEVGTVTPRPQDGNPKPRMFRLEEDEAVINRLGFNNKGIGAFTEALRDWQQKPTKKGIIGANIGKNKDTEHALDDYITLLQATYGLSDYITVNISSPNTPGLRDLQGKKELDALLKGIMEEHKSLATRYGEAVPLLVKMAPDVTSEQCKDIAEVVLSHAIDGLIVTNTTISRPESLKSPHAKETGGLSGKPLFSLSTDTLRTMYQLTEGKIPLIGVGGIASGADAYTKIRAGASLVQLYSALVYQGLGLVEQIKSELSSLLTRDGFQHIAEAVGVDAKKGL